MYLRCIPFHEGQTYGWNKIITILLSMYAVAINSRVGIDPLIWASDVSVSVKITGTSLIYLFYCIYFIYISYSISFIYLILFIYMFVGYFILKARDKNNHRK